MRRAVQFFLAMLLWAALAQAQEKKLKVYISADMEGIGGGKYVAGTGGPRCTEYEKFRRLMTLEYCGRRARFLPAWVERPGGSAIVLMARDMIEASKFLEAVLRMNTFPA